jgi:hypothetical protein
VNNDKPTTDIDQGSVPAAQDRGITQMSERKRWFAATLTPLQIVERYERRYNKYKQERGGSVFSPKQAIRQIIDLLSDHDARYEAILEKKLEVLLPLHSGIVVKMEAK